MRPSIVTCLSASVFAIGVLTASPDASAHFFALINTPPIFAHADDGSFILIQTDILHNTCNILTHEFVTHEMWYHTDSANDFWIEVGFLDGATTNIFQCETHADFWADSRPGGGVNEHFPGNGWSFGDWFGAEIAAIGNCTWAVALGGLQIGTSTNNCPGSGRVLQAGIESTSQSSGNAKGFLTDWWEQDGSGNWSQGWDGQIMFSNGEPDITQVADSSFGFQTEEVLNEDF